MEIVLLIIVVALITSIFVFKSDKFFYIYDSLEQKRAWIGQYLSGPWE
jgi:hypothetical protein